jgi:hypothetical protein
MVNKKINLELVGLNGNAFNLLGQFRKQARREKWTDAEINEVITEAKAKDYDHLVYTLDSHCDPTDSDEEDW